jgi:hypothetical protein
MNPIRLARGVVQAVAAAAPGDLVELEQTGTGVVLTLAAGSRAMKLVSDVVAPGGTVAAFTVSAGELSQAAAAVGAVGPGPAEERTLVMFRLSPELAAVTGPTGQPQTVTIVSSRLADCSGTIDTVEGERASGMTRAVGVVDSRELLGLAEAVIAMGCSAVEFVFAPRFGAVLAEASGGGITATALFVAPGVELEAPPRPDTNPLVFTVVPGKPRSRRPTAKPPAPPPPWEDDLPF